MNVEKMIFKTQMDPICEYANMGKARLLCENMNCVVGNLPTLPPSSRLWRMKASAGKRAMAKVKVLGFYWEGIF